MRFKRQRKRKVFYLATTNCLGRLKTSRKKQNEDKLFALNCAFFSIVAIRPVDLVQLHFGWWWRTHDNSKSRGRFNSFSMTNCNCIRAIKTRRRWKAVWWLFKRHSVTICSRICWGDNKSKRKQKTATRIFCVRPSSKRNAECEKVAIY